ncbi:MAG: 30S ribosomal protein S16 [Candidatus Omnitrophica bacterium]|nr:30S ribosomal protein S16 [Candidatus Omnitrophota bacterium]MBU1868897.1 30S ribosomal protein S16 [Candidatus Omnitrophota bacterium]
MAVHIRLRRIGKNPKGKPHFRLAVYDERTGRDGRVIEELGFYCPTTGDHKLKMEKIGEWIKKGAQLSPTVKSLFKKSQKGA